MNNLNIRVTICLAMVLVPLSMLEAQEGHPFRKWTSYDSMQSVRAQLVGASETTVDMRREDTGVVVRVPFEKLSLGDQGYVRVFHAVEKRNQYAMNSPSRIDEFRLVPLQDGGFELKPMGRLEVPAPGFGWQQVENSKLPTYVATNPDSKDKFELTLIEATAADKHEEFVRKDWDIQAWQVGNAGGTLLDVMAPFKQAAVDLTPSIYARSEDGSKHLMVYGFSNVATVRVKATGPRVRYGDDRAKKVVQNLIKSLDDFAKKQAMQSGSTPATGSPAIAGGLTDESKAKLDEYVSKLNQLVDEKKFGELLETVAPPEEIEKMKSQGQFDEVVRQVAEHDAPRLMNDLNSISWDKADFDQEKQLLRFNGIKASFMLLPDGSWRMRP